MVATPSSHRHLLPLGLAILLLVAAIPPAGAHSSPIDTSIPCPASTASAGFSDVAALDAETRGAIDCLASHGITKGTSATTYSPGLAVARWQMALFLVRQAQAHGVAVPAPAGHGFTDIGSLSLEARNAIDQLASLGITKGTSATTFSPTDAVTRWQMALFLHRLGLRAGIPFTPESGHGDFGDLAGMSAEAEASIEALADAHVALGVGVGRYDPASPVNRWQMALFLTRLLALGDVPASGSGYRFSPAGDVTLTRNAARTFTVSGLSPGGVYRVALVEHGEVSIGSDEGVVFGDDEGSGGQADGLGDEFTGAGRIDALGAVAITPVKEAEVTAGQSGQATVSVITSAYERFRLVLWDDDGNHEIDLDGSDRSRETFGISGILSSLAPVAGGGGGGTGTEDGSFTVEGVGEDWFVGTSGGSSRTFDLTADDTYTYGGAETVTFEQFLSWLSLDDLVTVDGYTAGGPNTFDLTRDEVGSPTDASATVGDFDQDAGTSDSDDVRLSWTASAGGKVAAYTVWLYEDDGDGGTSCSAGTLSSGPTSVGTATTHTFSDASVGDYCAAVRATSGTGQNSDLASSSSVSVLPPAEPSGPTITSLVLASDTLTTGVLDGGDVLTFLFSENMAWDADGGTVTLDGNATYFRVSDEDSVYQIACIDHATCRVSDGEDLSVTDDHLQVILVGDHTFLGQYVSGLENGIDLTGGPTVSFVSDAWADELGTPLDLSFSDVTID